MATTKDLTTAGGNNTVIGPSILINGKLTGDEDLTIRGRVEGEVTLSHTLIVETSGVVKANVAVKNAVVSGVVVGNINATESVELTREGRMVGDIHAPRVIIVDGASFRGRVDMGEVEPGRIPTTPRPAVRATVRPAAAPARPAAAGAAGGAAGGKPAAKPLPPPPPPPRGEGAGAKAAASAGGKPGAVAPTPPPPPAPPVVAAGAKKKVVIKKKGR